MRVPSPWGRMAFVIETDASGLRRATSTTVVSRRAEWQEVCSEPRQPATEVRRAIDPPSYQGDRACEAPEAVSRFQLEADGRTRRSARQTPMRVVAHASQATRGAPDASRHRRPSDRRGSGRNPGAAMCVQDVDAQCGLQFTLIHATGCALHRHTSRVIHRIE